MKISELRKALKRIKQQRGDINVVVPLDMASHPYVSIDSVDVEFWQDDPTPRAVLS